MTPLRVEVGHLPRYAFGQRSIIWWATMGMIAIEGAMFALVITSYLYLKGRSPHWPPGVESPRLLWGTLNTAIMLLSLTFMAVVVGYSAWSWRIALAERRRDEAAGRGDATGWAGAE